MASKMNEAEAPPAYPSAPDMNQGYYQPQSSHYNQQPPVTVGYPPHQQHVQNPQHINVVVQQPSAKPKQFVEPRNYPLPRQWKQELCGCFDDCGNCLLICLFPCCMACSEASKMNESVCIVCCTPHPIMAMRTKARMMYGIQGSICSDCLTTTCCGPCAQCQLHAQLGTMVELP